MFPASNPSRMDGTNTRPNGAKVTVTFDWLSLDIGNGRTFTANRSGGKVKGNVPNDVINAWFRRIDGKDGVNGTLIERINAFADALPTIWPAWNVAPDMSAIAVGVRGTMNLGPRKGNKGFVVVAAPKRKGGNWTIRFDGENGNILVAADMLVGTVG